MPKNIIKWTLIAAVLLALALPLTVSYLEDYTIGPDNSGLAERVDQWMARGTRGTTDNQIILYDFIDVGWERYVLADLNGRLAMLQLRKGITGRYKLESYGAGSANFRQETVFYDPLFARDSTFYFLFGGRNPGSRIASVRVVIDGVEYTVPVAPGEQFLSCIEIQADTSAALPDPNLTVFFDAAGTDITHLVER